jgi:hypothetical protein
MSLAQLIPSLFLLYPAPALLPTRNSNEIAGNKQNLISTICRSTLGELKVLRQMEDDINFLGKWKTTSIVMHSEDNLILWGQLETNSILYGRRPHLFMQMVRLG